LPPNHSRTLRAIRLDDGTPDAPKTDARAAITRWVPFAFSSVTIGAATMFAVSVAEGTPNWVIAGIGLGMAPCSIQSWNARGLVRDLSILLDEARTGRGSHHSR
jgi:hypothetical protein